MSTTDRPWNYLVVTASNETQARYYETQLGLRQKLGLITGVEQILVVPDPHGRRVGSGGSTIFALAKIITMECRPLGLSPLAPGNIENTLDRLRILIIHAGGDSRRLPAYGPCGKIFTPIPHPSHSVLGNTIFDRQFPIYRELPLSRAAHGQVVVTTGDVLLFFPPESAKFRERGITGLGCPISPEKAKNHGVFCSERGGEVRLFLQKPSISEQKKQGAIDSHGQSLLDIGVMQMHPAAAAKLIRLVDFKARHQELRWTGPIAAEISSAGLDFYRDICCAIGKEVCFDDFVKNVRARGSRLSDSFLTAIFDALSEIPFFVHPLDECVFLHFGTPRQLIETGSQLQRMNRPPEPDENLLSIDNRIAENGRIEGSRSWIEGCSIRSDLILGGENVVVGVDVDKPFSLPAKTCLDIIKGYNRQGENVWFIRIYGIDDSFKESTGTELRITNESLAVWLESMGIADKDIWTAKIFPALSSPGDYKEWLWMVNPREATKEQIDTWRRADRYSLEEMANLVDLESFDQRRRQFRIENIRHSTEKIFLPESSFSAADLAFILEGLDEKDRAKWIGQILEKARHQLHQPSGMDRLVFSRTIHTLGTAVKLSMDTGKKGWDETLKVVLENLNGRGRKRLASVGLDSSAFQDAETWCMKLQDLAFENMSRTIVWGTKMPEKHPRCAVRSDAIIWGRAPARLDLGGGWTDTPPYALEQGGCVINAAVNLNGQPPIHVYARVVNELAIKITSIDHGLRITIRNLDELMDYRKPTSEFSLAKAALVLSGFSLEKAAWPKGTKTLEDMLKHFGGGIELTTLAAIPSGSGLGTSSIMGAVLLSVINRMIGKESNRRELFNLVLQLEQELTTGGGWQDQIGGTLAGVKIITAQPGLVPDPEIRAVKPDLLDPEINLGQTLLYYTGMRRLAKNILRNIVGRYLDRNRRTMETLRKLHVFPPLLVDAMERADMGNFGELLERAFHLKKEIDPDSSNPEMETILKKFKSRMIGATFLGAGGGGFLLVVAKSPEDAEAAKEALKKHPPNPLARFFDYSVSNTGLEVSIF